MDWLFVSVGPDSYPHWNWQCFSLILDSDPPYGLFLVLTMALLSSSLEPAIVLTTTWFFVVVVALSPNLTLVLTVPWISSSLRLDACVCTAWLLSSQQPDSGPFCGPSLVVLLLDSLAHYGLTLWHTVADGSQWALILVLSIPWLFGSLWSDSLPHSDLTLVLSGPWCWTYLQPDSGPHYSLSLILTRTWLLSFLSPDTRPC